MMPKEFSGCEFCNFELATFNMKLEVESYAMSDASAIEYIFV